MADSNVEISELVSQEPLTGTETPRWLRHPLVSLFVGVVVGVIFGLVRADWLGGITTALLSALATFYFQNLLTAKESLRWVTRQAISTINALHHRQLFDMAGTLTEKQFEIYDDIMERVVSSGGAIVIKASEFEYLQYLERLLNVSENSFLATLRGGEFPRFSLEWFFKNEPGGLSKAQRFQWLTSVRDAAIETKIRLLVFSEDEIKDFLLQRDRRNGLLDAMLKSSDSVSLGSVFQVAPEDLRAQLGLVYGDEESRIVYDDYAIFDNQVVLKHNGAASLVVSIKNQIRLYREVFDLLRTRHDLFTMLTVSHYGDETWEEWEKRITAGDAKK